MIAILVVIPFVGACLALLARRYATLITMATGAIVAIATVIAALAVADRGTLAHELGGWAVPLGITLRADGLTAVLLVISAIVMAAALVHAGAYRREKPIDWLPVEGFWVLALLLWGALNALLLSADVFNLYVCLELMTLAAVALAVLDGDEAALDGAMRYLLAAFLASMLYLLGVGVLYAAYGRLDLEGLATLVVADPPTWLAAALITGSLALKTALFPLHFWLPRAHAAAPAPVSAILSSLVVTGSFYVFLRLMTGVFGALATPMVGQSIGALGAAAIIWGSLQAIRQQHLKVMIAYSTVAQVGYLFLAVPLISSALANPEGAVVWAEQAWDGAIYHAASHALAKASMFLAAGTIVLALGSDRIVGISGLATHLPITTYAFGIAGMTLIGLPPSGGFVAKWLLLSAAFASGQWWWAAVMVIGGILTAGYVFLVLGQELSHAESDRDVEFRPVPRAMEYAAMGLALVALALGVRVSEVFELLRVGLPFGGG